MKINLILLVWMSIFIYSNTSAQSNVRGWYADGQVWIVWESDTIDEPKTYAIYSSPTPFTDASQSTLIGRLFKEEWTPGAVFVDSLAPNPRYVIPDGAGNKYIVKANEGLFAETVHQTGSKYYAVLKVDEMTVTAGINITANSVDFIYSESEPVQCHLQGGTVLSTGHYTELYYMWADGRDDHRSGRPDFPIMANKHKNGMPSLFVVWSTIKLPPDTSVPAIHWLHGGEGTVSQNLPGKRELINIEPEDGIIISHNDDLPSYIGSSYRFETSNTWWFGWRNNLNPFDTTLTVPSTPDTVINYTQRRIIWSNDWLIKNRNVDPNRVSIQGHSMGSAGTNHIAKAFPNTFASSSIFNNGLQKPTGINAQYIYGLHDDNLPTNLISRNGNVVRVSNLFDLTSNISKQRDFPIMKIWNGKNDDSDIMQWDAFVADEYRHADSNGAGMQLYWDERGHRLGSPRGYWAKGVTLALQTERDNAAYQARFKVRQSYPAFFNHHSYPNSGNPGGGTRGTGGTGNGDDWGAWGGYHEWEIDSIIDTPSRWEVVAYLIGQSEWTKDNSPFQNLQADLAIRKPQQFLPAEGIQVNWQVVRISTGDTLQQGITTVGEDDLVTVRDITLYRDPHRVKIGFSAVLTSVQNSNHHSPINYELQQNHPNPFNPETIIRYDISKSGDVQLSIHNMLGQKVRTLINDRQVAGNHQIAWNGRNDSGLPAASGIYLYRLRVGNSIETKKMLLIR